MKVLFLSHTPYSSYFRVGSHHLASEVAELGNEVLHVASPFTLAHLPRLAYDRDTRAKLALACRRERGSDLVWQAAALSALPLGVEIAGRVAKARLCTRNVRRLIEACFHDTPDVTFVDQPVFDVILDGVDLGLTIYRGTDIHAMARYERAVARLARRADGIVATSEAVLASIPRDSTTTPSLVMTNGVDCRHFTPGVRPWTERSGAVYVGAVDYRLDVEAIIELARAAPAEPVRLAGPISVALPTLPPNVIVLGPVDYSVVPALMQEARVGLLPFNQQHVNSGRSPMKYFEYLAAGLFVLGTQTKTLEQLRRDGVGLYRDTSQLRALYIDLLTQDCANLGGMIAAQRENWGVKAVELMGFAGDVLNRGRPKP